MIRAITLALSILLLTGCARAPDPAATARDCLQWRGQRYCFPRLQLSGIGSTEAQTTATIRVPLAAQRLRTCNASLTRLDAALFAYDNVDVTFQTVTRRSSPDWIYRELLRLRVGARAPDWRTAGAIRCWRNQPIDDPRQITCLEREPATGAVHLVSCRPREPLGIPTCRDESVSPAFDTIIHAHVACFPHRSALRREVAAYLAAHRVPRTTS